MKDVFITIKGVSGFDGEEKDIVEFSTEGTLEILSDKTVLNYNESENIGVKNVKTEFTVNRDGSVVMQRSGGMTSRLEIIPKRRNTCIYSTAYGELNIGVFGEKVENRIGEHGGKFTMSYTLDQNLKPISRNEVHITVKEI